MTRALAVISRLRELGMCADDILSVVEAMESAEVRPASKGAERTRKWRDRKASNVTSDVTVTSQDTEPSRACSNTNLPSEDISYIPPLPPKGGDGRKAEPRNRGHRLPLDWQPDADLIEFARSHGFSTDQEREARAEFADYWRGVPGSRGCKTDWPATYRNRLREVAAKRKLKPAPNVLPFSTGSPQKPQYTDAEMRERALDFDKRWKAGEFAK